MKNKYQKALDSLNPNTIEQEYSWRKSVELLQELVDKETSLTPTYKNTKIEKEHYLDKDYKMLYHCPKCDNIVYPISRCNYCNQKLNWNKYYVIEKKDNKTFYQKRS